MYKAIVYRIQGPRSLTQAVENFNKMDHSSKIYEQKSGLGAYIKYSLGKDFVVKALAPRDGVEIESQKLEADVNGIKIHVPTNERGKERIFNAVLIYESSEGLFKPVYLIALDDIEIPKDTNQWINIDVGLNKLKPKKG